MTSADLSLSVIIPIYNEAKDLEHHLCEVFDYFNNIGCDFEIIAVNDGSTDESLGILNKFNRDHKNFFIINNENNRGKGYSVKRGIAQAKKAWLLYLDADLSTPPNELNKFLPVLEQFDFIIGSRRAAGSLVLIHQPSWKETLGQLGNRLIKLVLGLSFDDTQCGFKLLNAKLKPLGTLLTIDGWGFDMELLYLAKKFNFKTTEIGISWRNDFDSKVKLSSYFKTLLEVFYIKLNDWQGRYSL